MAGEDDEYPLRDDVQEARRLLMSVADELDELEDPLDRESLDIAVEDVSTELRDQAEALTFATAAVAAIENVMRRADDDE